MALDPATQNKRIKAAAALVGMNLDQFERAVHEAGMGKSTVTQIMRAGGPKPPENVQEMTYAAATAMGKVSGLPPEWFTAGRLEDLFDAPDEFVSLRRDVDRLVHRLEGLEAALVEGDLLDTAEIDRILDSLDTTEPPQDEVPGEDEGLQHG